MKPAGMKSTNLQVKVAVSNVWFTSDLHIGHDKVAATRAPANAIFPAVVGAVTTWHDCKLANNWDAVVGKDDLVYVLGDLSLQGTGATNAALDWIGRRKGRKVLVPGNHCPIHSGINRDYKKWVPRYREVFEDVELFIRKRIAGQNVLMSHFPYQGAGDHTVEERYTQYRLPDLGEWLIHGHTHSKERLHPKICQLAIANGEEVHRCPCGGSRPGHPAKWSHKMIHVGVDAWDLSPVPMSAIEEIINVEPD
jgi:calcineurin-like phosphoesterase family protein